MCNKSLSNFNFEPETNRKKMLTSKTSKVKVLCNEKTSSTVCHALQYALLRNNLELKNRLELKYTIGLVYD